MAPRAADGLGLTLRTWTAGRRQDHPIRPADQASCSPSVVCGSSLGMRVPTPAFCS